MTTDPTVLATKIAKYIDSQPEAVTYEHLEERALSKGISIDILENALSILHKRKRVDVTTKDGIILYKKKKVKPPKAPPKKPDYERPKGMEDGDPIPLYWPEHDGPSPVYGPEYRAFIKQKNLDLKRAAEEGVYQRGGKSYGRK